MSGKSCILDPIPGVLLRDCYETLLPVIARIVNLSLDNAILKYCFYRNRVVGGTGGACAPPIFLNYKELVRKSVFCPPPPQSQSPTKFKEAALNPIIKKACLDHEL